METVIIAICCLLFLAGVFLGMGVHAYIIKRRSDGTLNIDKRDPETDRYSLDFSTDLDEVSHKKTLIFAVKTQTR